MTIVLPDPIVAARTHLVADPLVTALIADRVHTRTPRQPTWPLVRLRRVGGGRSPNEEHRLERAVIDIHAYDADQDDGIDHDSCAHEVARTVYASLLDCCGTPIGDAVVVHVASISAPQSIPDSAGDRTPPLRRYIATVEMTFRIND